MKIKNLIIGVMLLILLVSFASARLVICSVDEPVSLWSFDETFGNIASDSCNNNNGTLINMEDGDWVSGHYNNSLLFDGTDEFVNVKNSENLNITSEMTLMAWIYPSASADKDIIKKTGAYTLTLDKVGANLLVRGSMFSGGSEYTATSTTPLNLNEWVHILMTYRNSYVYVYVNGTQEGQSTQCAFCKITANDNNVTIGGDLNYYAGQIDETAIFNKSLNASEIMNLASPCTESWIANYTPCNVSDKKVKYYYDLNNCGTTYLLPADNGTIEDCDYCSPTWACTSYDNSCSDLITSPEKIYCLSVSPTNSETCCEITNLSSDCVYTGDYSEYDKLCGDIEVVLSVLSYPFVDLNTSFPMKLYLYQDGISKNPTNFSMKLTEPDLNISYFDWIWDNSDERYELTLIFTEEGSYPFVIYAYYPYDKIQNITGTFIVKEPYYITFNFFETKDKSVKPYDNDFGYVFLEFSNQQIYDKYLENFLTPLFFNTQFNLPKFVCSINLDNH